MLKIDENNVIIKSNAEITFLLNKRRVYSFVNNYFNIRFIERGGIINMAETNGKVLFHGIDNINDKLDDIIESMKIENKIFEIKLILIEAVNNAFIHGNKKDKEKPICFEWKLKDNLLEFSVTDCGAGVESLSNHNYEEEDILSESGRGLLIINSYSDLVEFKGNSIIMKKYI
jgi:serine/threonine-protein kinase RsbW